MEYTFYRITHPEYPELNYIGSTKNIQNRKYNHKSQCYNKITDHFNKPLYQFIRNNSIVFEELQWTILNKLIYESREGAHKWERFLIESFDTIENGLNEILPYKTTEEKRIEREEFDKKYKNSIKNI